MYMSSLERELLPLDFLWRLSHIYFSTINLFLLPHILRVLFFWSLRLSSIVERSTEVEHGTTSTYEKPKDQKDTELETDLEKCALVTASGKGPGKEQSKSEEMDLPRDGGKKRESDEPIRRASLPPGSKRPDSSKPPPRLSSSEILIVVFTSRLSLLIVVLLMMQSMRVVSMVSPGLGPLSFFSEKACYVTVAAVNYLITGYLYGYYPRELWDVFRELMETFWGPCSPFARRRTSLTDVHPVETWKITYYIDEHNTLHVATSYIYAQISYLNY